MRSISIAVIVNGGTNVMMSPSDRDSTPRCTIPAPTSAQGQNGSHRTETPSAGDQGTATDRPLATISSTVQPNPEG